MVLPLLFFVLGVVWGSFFNVCIYRIPKAEDICLSRSYCPACQHTLGILDLVPLFSYAFLGGKCRYCNTTINIRYPLVELLTGILFASTFYFTGLDWILLPKLIIVSLLIIISFIDLEHMIIPHSLTITGMLTALVWQFTSHHLPWPAVIWGFVLGFGLPAVFVFFGGMGGGDAMLGGMLGIFLGLKSTFVFLLLAFIIGGIFSIYVLITKQKKRNDKLPFGPFLAIAGLLMLLWGSQIVSWYGL